jgi:hypothetical protein
MCSPERPDRRVLEDTEAILRRHDGDDLVAVLERYEAELRAREERDPAARLALARVFERLYDEREIVRERMAEGSPLAAYVAARPGGADLLSEAAWLYVSVASGRVPPEFRVAALRGLADVFRRKERDVTACVCEPLAQDSEFAWGLLRYVLLRCEVQLRAAVAEAAPEDAAAREALRDAVARLAERALLLMRDEQTGPTFHAFFAEAAARARKVLEAEDPAKVAGEDIEVATVYLPVRRRIQIGLSAKQLATELQAAQADPVGVFRSYERALEHLVFAAEATCALHEHPAAPAPSVREHVRRTLEVCFPIAQEMIWRR